MNYNRINNLVGWLVFLIASYVYISTIEPTGSFWDCGEFIATAHKLEVGHPPGISFLPARARVHHLRRTRQHRPRTGDGEHPVGADERLYHPLPVLDHHGYLQEADDRQGEVTTDKLVAVMGAGVVGALAYTFSDSFWFSAVEGKFTPALRSLRRSSFG